MRSCPRCQTTYPDDGVEICARDGARLVAAAGGDVGAEDVGSTARPPSGPSMASSSDGSSIAAPTSIVPPAVASSDAVVGTAAFAAVAAVPAAMPAPGSGEIFDSLVGATLAGRYKVIRRIGEGGMGAVYEARHTIIGKRVAVKVLLEKFLAKSDFVARLLQEARLASAIGHEHIVDVTDFGTTDDGRAFVAMEFLEGESLAELVMREAPLPVERSLRIARQVASALGAAHAKGIVHRDVKPENVYLIRRGDADFVKVVDFGISKAVKQGQGDDAPDYRLTHTGLLLGTPLYMSPEQARGDEDLDERVDVWAMGVMLYECLTGEVPFRANNYLGIISQVLTHTAVPPSQLRPELGIPEAVEAVVMHAMEKDRARRYAAMSDVEGDLERLLAGDQNVGAGTVTAPATVPPAGPARGRAWVWGAAVAALVVGVALALARPDGVSRAAAPAGQAAGAVASPIAGGAQVGATSVATSVVSAQAGATSVAASAATSHSSPKSTAPSASPSVSAPGGRAAAALAVSAAGGETNATRRAIRPIARLARGHADRSSHGEPGSDLSGMAPRSADAVIRGALPSRSGEGYPDN